MKRATNDDQLARETSESLVRAAAAMSEWWMGDNLALALLETGRALYGIARLDHDERAYRRISALLTVQVKP